MEPTEPVWTRLIGAVERVAIKSLTTGNFVWFGLFLIAAIAVFKLDSKDLKEVLDTVLVTYGWIGYPVSGIVILASIKILRWRERFYKDELARMGEVRNLVQ